MMMIMNIMMIMKLPLMVRQGKHQFSRIWFFVRSICSCRGCNWENAFVNELCWRLCGGATLRWLLAASPSLPPPPPPPPPIQLFFNTLGNRCKTPCYKRDHYEVITMSVWQGFCLNNGTHAQAGGNFYITFSTNQNLALSQWHCT